MPIDICISLKYLLDLRTVVVDLTFFFDYSSDNDDLLVCFTTGHLHVLKKVTLDLMIILWMTSFNRVFMQIAYRSAKPAYMRREQHESKQSIAWSTFDTIDLWQLILEAIYLLRVIFISK